MFNDSDLKLAASPGPKVGLSAVHTTAIFSQLFHSHSREKGHPSGCMVTPFLKADKQFNTITPFPFWIDLQLLPDEKMLQTIFSQLMSIN